MEGRNRWMSVLHSCPLLPYLRSSAKSVDDFFSGDGEGYPQMTLIHAEGRKHQGIESGGRTEPLDERAALLSPCFLICVPLRNRWMTSSPETGRGIHR